MAPPHLFWLWTLAPNSNEEITSYAYVIGLYIAVINSNTYITLRYVTLHTYCHHPRS